MSLTNRRTQAWMVVVLAGLLSSALEAQQRVAFVTSVNGTADLGSWPEAGSAVGAAAGDAICRTLAADAALDNAGTFIAWLSTSTDDAYCRLHGFSGKKSANCGQAQLPVDAGPWVRTDGLPFGESIDRLLLPESVVYYPLAADEDGNPVQSGLFTATAANGALSPHPITCGDWTAASMDHLTVGSTARGSNGWTNTGSSQCDFTRRLICLEPGSGPALTPPDEAGAVAFLTSVFGSGDMGSWPDAGGHSGLAAADAICQARAAAGNLANPSTFKAWLSDSTIDAKDRFVFDRPRVRPDGVRVGTSLTDMLDGSLDSSINVTELGTYRGNDAVWTATQSNGLFAGDSCSDWTSANVAEAVRTGSSYAANSAWTLIFTSTCNTAIRLYCIEDSPEPIFVDGFESGDTTAWSSVVQRLLVWP
jgi:hypothetical protein